MRFALPTIAGLILSSAITVGSSAGVGAVPGDTIAFDMVGSSSQNLNSFTNNAPTFSSVGDAFGKLQRGVTSIPFSLVDDSLTFATDSAGIVGTANTDEFFGVTDTENPDNSGPVTASWAFDVTGEPVIDLSVDIGAMGDFESADFFTWTYSFDGGPTETAIASSVDEDGSQSYTLEDGDTFVENDPMLANGVLLDNNFATFTVPLVGSGSELVLTLTAETNSGAEAFAFQNLVITEGQPGTAADLLLTEVVVTPTGGEFVEIHNAGTGPVDLSDVYLTDATFSGGSFYYNIVTGSNAGGGGFGDFHARFPDGASIAVGEYQTVALAGSDDFAAEYGSAPTYELFEDGAADSVPDMREALAGSVNGQGGLSNSGEIVVLYTWDGSSDLVQDVDYFVWGDKAEAVDKTSVSVDGPDGDAVASTYLNDTAIASQDVVAGGSHASGNSWQRDDLTEGDEVQTGGNGAAGSDETSENVSGTWCDTVPTPGAASACPLPPVFTPYPIHEVQGNGLVSPMVGAMVEIDGIVVGDFQESSELNGFYVQEADADADGDPATSEGIFVFEGGSNVAVAEGDFVTVTGTVAEFSGLTEITSVDTVVVGSSGNPLPAPTVVTFPLSAVNDLEAYEGMAVSIPGTLVISEFFNYDRYGEMVLTNPFGGLDRHFTPTSYVSPGPAAIAVADEIAVNRITLDDGSGRQNPDILRMPDGTTFAQDNFFRGGDLVSDVVGVMDFARGRYRVQPTDVASYTSTNVRQSAPDDVGGSITVATLNVLNYFLTLDNGSGALRNVCGPDQNQGCRGADDSEEFDRQRAKLMSALLALDADVIGLVELENTPGVSPEADIVAGLNDALGAGTYDYVDAGVNGEDPIRVGIVYRTDAVLPFGDHAVLDQSVDPTFDDDRNRPAVAQSFVDRSTGGVTTVAVNHLKSKGSSCSDLGDPDLGDGQANCNLTRTAAAVALVNWLAGDPTGSGQSDAMIVGDLNSYDEEDPIAALLAGGYTDLVEATDGEFSYSYVFDGQWGSLDYAFASAGLNSQVSGVTTWHINADEADAFDYNTSFRGPGQQALYSPNPFRVSDHDPVLVGLDLDLDAHAVLGAVEDIVEALLEDGSLNKGQANALSKKLQQALRDIDRGQLNGASGVLTGVVSQVNDFVADGILTADEGAAITDLVEAVLAGL